MQDKNELNTMIEKNFKNFVKDKKRRNLEKGLQYLQQM